MKLTRKSKFTGAINTIELPMSEEAFQEAHAAWKDGELIQNAFPNLTPAQREFILTGCTEDEWNKLWGEDDA